MAEDNDKKITNPTRLLAASSESTSVVVEALSPLQEIAASIKEGFSSFGKKLDKQVGATKASGKVGGEERVEASRASKEAKKNRQAMLKKLSGLYKNSMADRIASKAAAKASKLMRNHWGKLLLLGLFFIPKKTWIKIGEYALKVFNVLREIDWVGVFETLGNAITQIVDFLIPIFEWFGKKLFGEKTKEEDYKKQEQLVGGMGTDEDGKRNKQTDWMGREESNDEWRARQAKESKKLADMGSYETNEKTGKKEFKGKRQGGLFGNNRGIMDIVQGAGAAILAFGLIFAPGATLFLGFKLFRGALGKLSRGIDFAGKKLAGVKVPGTQKLGKGLTKPPGWEKMSKAEQKTFNKKAGAKLKAGGAPKVSTPKVTGQKLLTQGSGASKVPKPPAAGGSKPGMMMKALKKFPKLAKAMPVLKKIPIIGKVFTAGAIGMALAGGAGKKELIPMIGGLFGGAGGAILGSAIGGMLGVAGGPLAIVTGLLGGIGGAMAGDTLGIGVAQWLMGEKVDAFGFGFGWVNDILNGGTGPAEGSGTPAAAAPAEGAAPSDIGGGKEPMSKNQFLKSDKYKATTGAGTKDFVGESSGAKKDAYANYLKGEDSKKNDSDKKLVDQLIDTTRARAKLGRGGKPIKAGRMSKKHLRNARKREWGKFGQMLSTHKPEWRALALESLSKDELQYVNTKESNQLKDEQYEAREAAKSPEQKAAEAKKLAASTGSSAGDAMFEEPIVTPAVPRVSPQDKTTALKQSTDKMLDGKSAQQSASVNVGGATHNKTVTTSTQSTIIAQNPASATQDKFWNE